MEADAAEQAVLEAAVRLLREGEPVFVLVQPSVAASMGMSDPWAALLRPMGLEARSEAMAVQLAAVALANAQKPDLVVVTGDFVCHSQAYLDQLVEVMRAFTAPVVGVLGNHDYWSGAAGTSFWIDPTERLYAVLMIQAPVQREYYRLLFRDLVYTAIAD